MNKLTGLCALVLITVCAGNVAGLELPGKGIEVLTPAPLTTLKPKSENKYGTIVRYAPTNGLYRDVVQVAVTALPANGWDLQFQFATAVPIEKNDVLLMRFFARTVATPNERGNGRVRAIFEERKAPHTKSLNHEFELTREWQEYYVPFIAEAHYAAGTASAGFHLGLDLQTVEFADFHVLSFGKTVTVNQLPRMRITYPGMEPDAQWRKDALQRIETLRKKELVVHVVDAQGKPVSNATIIVRQTRQAFGWGSAVTAANILRKDSAGERYREIISNCFSRVVFENDLKWSGWENRQRQQMVLDAANWLAFNKIEVRGHCLVWPSWRNTPKELKALAASPAALRTRIHTHITNEVQSLRGLVVDWDVVNEPYDNTDLLKLLGTDEMVTWFKLARCQDPQANLYLNDYAILSAGGLDTAHQAHFEKTLRMLIDKGAPIHGLGMQSHFGSTPTPPERILAILDRFAKLGLKITITEHDIDTLDEQFQAEFTRDFLIAVYSHPAVVAVLTWGFWEEAHWRPNAAYYRSDWSLRPAGEVWLEWVTRKWRTREKGRTRTDGTFTVRGFEGDYEIIVQTPRHALKQYLRLVKPERLRIQLD